MHGHRVAAVDGVVPRGVDDHLAMIPALQRERLPLDVHRDDRGAGAVAHAVAAVVAQAEDPVAGLVLLAVHGQRGSVHTLGLDRPGPGELVEGGNLVAPMGQDHGVDAPVLEPRMLGDHLGAPLGHQLGDVDAAVAQVQLIGGAGLAVAHQLEGCSLPGLLLAHVLGDQHPADVLTQGAHRCPRADGLELRGVADHDQLGVVPCRERDQLGKLAVADHARLVDHEHAAGWQVVDLELVEHAGDRPGGDVRARLEHVGGRAGERAADDLDAGGLERLPAHVEREGLADPGGALDDHHAGRALADGPGPSTAGPWSAWAARRWPPRSPDVSATPTHAADRC